MSVERLTRIRLPNPAADFTQIAADLTALRRAISLNTVSFQNAWPDQTMAIRNALGSVVADLDAAVGASDVILGQAIGFAGVVAGGIDVSLAAAFLQFNQILDEEVVLLDMDNLSSRMLSNIELSGQSCSDSDYPKTQVGS